MTRGGEADRDDDPDILLDPPVAEALLDPPESDSEGRQGDRPEKASGMKPKQEPSSPGKRCFSFKLCCLNPTIMLMI